MTRRILALSLSTLCAAAILLVAWRWRPERPDLTLVDRGAQVDALLASRLDSGSNVTGHGPFRLEAVTEEVARQLFVMHPSGLVHNPWCYYRYRPGLRETVAWPEHPDGVWLRVTNAAGLREDEDRDFAGADLRILVAGDSHTDGVCNNSESFTHQLEALIAEREPTRRVVALNTGVSGYSFYNYLGVLEEALAQAHGELPDVFVVAVYGGNDFVEALRPQHYFRGTRLPPRRSSYWSRLEAAQRVSTSALGQGLNQVAYFLEHPEQIEVALEASRAVLGEIQRRCLQHGVRLVVVHIPAAFDLPWPGLEPLLERALGVLELERSDLSLGREFEQHLREELADAGVEYLDATELFAASSELCFWERDLHISIAGQRAIARALDELLAREAASLDAPHGAPPADGPFERRGPAGELSVVGTYLNGLRTGLWTAYHPDGTLRARGSYREGRRTGPWEWWYPGEQRQKRGAYEDDHATGTWIEWYRDGQVRREGEWRGGTAQGLWREWHPDGSLASEGAYEAGRHHGEWRQWYPGGQLRSLSTWDQDQREGPAETWSEEGHPISRGAYRAGVRHGRWVQWWPGKILRNEGLLVDGQREGPTRFYDEEGRFDPDASGIYADGRKVAPLPPALRDAPHPTDS